MEQRGPAVHDFFVNTGGTGEMIKAPIELQELRRRIYVKAKAEPSWRLERQGFGWKRWSTTWLYEVLGLFGDYRVRRYRRGPKALPVRQVT